MRSIDRDPREEAMAVVVQEIVGLRRGDLFYPYISGVGRSYNYYPIGRARPEDGVVNLALGLGKAIVDGGLTWSYSPARPRVGPPFNGLGDLVKNTQTSFWGVNMGTPPPPDPVRETEFLVQLGPGPRGGRRRAGPPGLHLRPGQQTACAAACCPAARACWTSRRILRRRRPAAERGGEAAAAPGQGGPRRRRGDRVRR